MFRHIHVLTHTRGLLFRENEFLGVVMPGSQWRFDPLLKLRMDTVSPRDPWLVHRNVDIIARSGKLGSEAIVLDLRDNERALVWIDGRFDRIVAPGLYVLWTSERTVRVDVIDAREMRFVHNDLAVILASPRALNLLDVMYVQPGHNGLWFRDGLHQATVGPGTYAFWKDVGKLTLMDVDLRELFIDISGQEIMTADKVTLRLNALLTYRVVDPLRSVTVVDGSTQALYRAAQLALREAVGARELDALLAAKDSLGSEVAERIAHRATELGMVIVSAGVRDVILPGEMKELMNKVTEAKKAAEASLITRREETAAMRMQANTAKILESSPTLMKLKELEVLEKVAGKANLTVVLGDEGLSNRVVKML
jgi:regulator of protease activity HflC (stomatin/prohibitin superfamily)